MKLSTFLNILNLLFLFSCKSETEESLQSNLSPIWEKDFQVGLTTCINPVLLDKSVVFSSYERKNPDLSAPSRLICFQKDSGEDVWEWINKETSRADELLLLTPIFEIENNLYFSVGPRCYAVNSLTGKTLWFKSYGDFAITDLIRSNDGIYYLIGEDFTNTETLISIDLLNADTLSIMGFTNHDSVDEYRGDFIIEEKYIYFSNVKNKLFENKWNSTPFISKYDRESKEIIQEIRLENSDLATNVSCFKKYGNNIIIAITNKNLIKIDMESGKIIWSNSIPSNLFFPDFVITDSGQLYIVTEANLMCVDIATGTIIWDVVPEHLGLNSRMVLHKGVLYFVSGGRLNAFEANNGRQLMSLTAPSIKWSGVSDNFQSVMTLDAENDRIYTASYTAAYCYPTLNLKDL